MTDRTRPRILLVEDDRLMQRSLARQLERRFDAEVTCRSSALDALALLADGALFDAAVVDLEMPEMDGAELVERMADVAPCIPVALWSGSDRLFELETRASFRLSKAQPIRDVLDAVDAMLERRRPVASAVVSRGDVREKLENGSGNGTDGR